MNNIDILVWTALERDGKMSFTEAPMEQIMRKKEKILQNHNHSIWQRTDGRWCSKVGSGKEKRLIVRVDKTDLENEIVGFYINLKKDNRRFDEIFRDYIVWYVHSGRSERSAERLQNDFTKYIQPLPLSKKPLTAVTEQDLIDSLKYIVYERNDRITHKRFSNVKMVINGLFKYAKYEENIPCLVTTEILKNVTFPSGAFQQSKSKIDNLQVLKLSEIELIRDRLKKSTNLKDLGILLTLDTGLRIGELCTLKKEDYKDNCLHITRSEQRNKKEGYHIGLPKGKKSRIVELSDHAETIVKTIISLTEGDGYMFPDEKRGWIRSYLFDKALRRLCVDIDIPQRSMHKLRKTYASYLLNACNLSDKMVQKQLGHLDISTTHASYNYDIFDREDKQSSFKNIKVGRM